jgi:hypothetical protein
VPTTLEDRQPTSPPSGPESEAQEAQVKRAEKWFFAGVIITGSILVGPLGLPVLAYGIYQLRQIEKHGRGSVRPWHVSVIGAFAIIDAAANFVGWSFCTFAAQTGVSWTILRDGYGYGFDGFYYGNYGNSFLIHGVAGPGEQSYIYMAMFVLWPMRLCAAWAFLQMKQWGFRWMIITTWMLVLFWVGWTTNGLMHFEERFGAAGGEPEFGYLGYWIFNSVFILGPVAMVPYLYTVKPKLWNKT